MLNCNALWYSTPGPPLVGLELAPRNTRSSSPFQPPSPADAHTSGICVCFGNVQDPVLLENAKLALREMGADKIQIDTSHFVCTTAAATPGVEFHPRMFRGGVRHHGGNSRKTLPTSVCVQIFAVASSMVPFQSDRCLRYIAHLTRDGYTGSTLTERVYARKALAVLVKPVRFHPGDLESFSLFCSSDRFWYTARLTIEPVVAPCGSRIDGNSIRCARSPSRIRKRWIPATLGENSWGQLELTAIPASTCLRWAARIFYGV